MNNVLRGEHLIRIREREYMSKYEKLWKVMKNDAS